MAYKIILQNTEYIELLLLYLFFSYIQLNLENKNVQYIPDKSY